jgi:hypothetical protein
MTTHVAHGDSCARKICDFTKRHIQRKPIEFFGVVVVGIYAAITFCQWRTLKNSVDTQILISRPVLIQNWTDVIEDGKNTKAWVTFRNFGKSMAVNAIAPGRLYVRDDGAPINSDCSYRCAPTKAWDLETISIAPTTSISDDRPWQQPWSVADGEALMVLTTGGVARACISSVAFITQTWTGNVIGRTYA